MIIEILSFGEYGLYVWTSFIFTLTVCFSLYLKTNKELKKQEILFYKEFKEVNAFKAKTSKDKKQVQLSSSLTF
tara:strand:+ start:511 stop:732 length:222 start_codon:yes stop_codon:yes gene_type:complete